MSEADNLNLATGYDRYGQTGLLLDYLIEQAIICLDLIPGTGTFAVVGKPESTTVYRGVFLQTYASL